MKPQNIIVKVNSADATIDTLRVQPGSGKPATLKAQGKVNYEFLDADSNYAPENITAKRSGKDLHIAFEGSDIENPDLIIENYYDHNQESALIGLAENGQYYPFVPESAQIPDSVSMLADQMTATQALGGSLGAAGLAAPWASTALWGIGALALVGLVAIGEHNDWWDDDDKPADNRVPGADNSGTQTPASQVQVKLSKNINTPETLERSEIDAGSVTPLAVTFPKEGNFKENDELILKIDGQQVGRDGKPTSEPIKLSARDIADGISIDVPVDTAKPSLQVSAVTRNPNNGKESAPANLNTAISILAPEVVATAGDITATPNKDAVRAELKYTPAGAAAETTLQLEKTTDAAGNPVWQLKDGATPPAGITIDPQSGKVTIPADKVQPKTKVEMKDFDANNIGATGEETAKEAAPADSRVPGGAAGSEPQVALPDDAQPKDGLLSDKEIGTDKTTPAKITFPQAGNYKAGDEVTVTANGKPVGQPHKLTEADIANGYTVEVPAAQDGKLEIVAKVTNPANGQGSQGKANADIDTTAPEIANLKTDPASGNITGTTEPGAVITDKTGKEIAKADAQGNFTIPKDQIPADGIIQAKDAAGNTSADINTKAPADTRVPGGAAGSEPQVALPDDAQPKDGLLSDKEIGTDKTTPAKITFPQAGNYKAGDEVTVTANGKPVGQPHKLTEADIANGYTVEVPAAQDGKLEIVAKVTNPANGQGSQGKANADIDTTAPEIGNLKADPNSGDISGTIGKDADPAKVVITDKNGTPIDGVTVNPDGTFTVPKNKVPADGIIKAQDPAGNASHEKDINDLLRVPGEGAGNEPQVAFSEDSAPKDGTLSHNEIGTDGKTPVQVTFPQPGGNYKAGDELVLTIGGQQVDKAGNPTTAPIVLTADDIANGITVPAPALQSGTLAVTANVTNPNNGKGSGGHAQVDITLPPIEASIDVRAETANTTAPKKLTLGREILDTNGKGTGQYEYLDFPATVEDTNPATGLLYTVKFSRAAEKDTEVTVQLGGQATADDIERVSGMDAANSNGVAYNKDTNTVTLKVLKGQTEASFLVNPLMEANEKAFNYEGNELLAATLLEKPADFNLAAGKETAVGVIVDGNPISLSYLNSDLTLYYGLNVSQGSPNGNTEVIGPVKALGTTDYNDTLYIGYHADGSDTGSLGNFSNSVDYGSARTFTDNSGNFSTIDMGAGDDFLRIRGNQQQQTRVYLGEGDDTYHADRAVSSTVALNTNDEFNVSPYVFGEGGNDTFVIGKSPTGASLAGASIYAGSGSDTITIEGFVNLGSIIDLGSGRKMPAAYRESYKANSDFSLGNDDNTDLATDTNTLIIKGNFDGTSEIWGGAGKDIITIGGTFGLNGISRGYISTGAGDDIISLNSISRVGNHIIDGGEGRDVLNITGSGHTGDALWLGNVVNIEEINLVGSKNTFNVQYSHFSQNGQTLKKIWISSADTAKDNQVDFGNDGITSNYPLRDGTPSQVWQKTQTGVLHNGNEYNGYQYNDNGVLKDEIVYVQTNMGVM